MVVSQINRKKRVSLCLEKRKPTVNNYLNTVIFSDQIVLGENHRGYVWRSSNEAYLSQWMCPPRQRRVSIRVWGCITYYGVATLCLVNRNINAKKYISILENHMWPVIAQHFSNKTYRFQDDNAPVHRAHITRDCKLGNNISAIVWPAQSPDISIIEKLWLRIRRPLQKWQQNITTPEELFAVVSDIWTSFDLLKNYVRTLYDSIPRRLLAVIKSKGHLTKYKVS